MYMIEIKEDKFDKMAEYTEKMLKYGGKLMSCLSEVGEEYGMDFREGGSMGNRYNERGGGYGNRYSGGGGSMGNRGGYGSRYGERGGYGNKEDEDEWEDEMNERRGVRGSGRGRRY